MMAWMYILVLVTSVVLLCMFWLLVVRVYMLRRFYEKQGIVFVKDCYAVIGAELRVSKLREKNRSHDWLYTERPSDLVGTIRGHSVQLYGTSAELCETLIHQTGTYVDRDTPALFSFGQLSPFSITFTRYTDPFFAERKAALIRGMNGLKHLFSIANRQAMEALAHFHVEDGSGEIINIRHLLTHWTRETSGEFIWGRYNVNRYVHVFDENNVMKCVSFMAALNQTFTDLRFYSDGFWSRVYFPLATWPLTREARRLQHNIRVLRQTMDCMIACADDGSVAENVQRNNEASGIPNDVTRDDLITATTAGLDTVAATTMATLWHLFQNENIAWREKVLSETKVALENPDTMYMTLSRCENLNAVIYETLRHEPPGSLINNSASHDFDLPIGDRSYNIKAGTRIMTCIHALHQNDLSWQSRIDPKTTPLAEFDPSRFVQDANGIVGSSCFMPFGKGPRRCPGQAVALLMVKSFITAFLHRNSKCSISIPNGQPKDFTCFNILSRATYNIHCSNNEKNSGKGL